VSDASLDGHGLETVAEETAQRKKHSRGLQQPSNSQLEVTCSARLPSGSCQVANGCSGVPDSTRLWTVKRLTAPPATGATASTRSSGDRLSDARPMPGTRA